MKINLRTYNGHYLVADQGGSAKVLANRDFPGLWETFTLINRDGESDRVETGNRINLQVWNGRFICAEGGGGREVLADREWPREWETFIIEKVAGSGEISHGDAVALRTHNGQYIVAEGGGGGDVLANRDHAHEWETFIVEFWPVKLITLRAHNGQYVVAEGGGGAEILANRYLAGPWETFALINRTGRSDRLTSGDRLSLQAWNGQFVVADGGGGGGVAANRNRAGTWETFTISKVGGSGQITDGEAIALRAYNGQYLVAEGGGGREVLANRTHVREWETFTLEFSENAPIPFERVMIEPVREGRPLDPESAQKRGTRSILTLLLEYSSMPSPIDDTLTLEHAEEKLYGSAQSVRSWLERNSFGSFTITNAGIYGPISVPRPFSYYHPQPPDVLWKDVMDAAEAAGVPLNALDRDGNGIIGGEEVLPIIFDFSDWGGAGSQRTVDVTTVRGTRYRGPVIGMGLYLKGGPAQGADQLEGKFYSTLVHELGHSFFGFPDRYGYRAPIRGDVIANRHWALEWERFVIEKTEGPGEIQDGDTVNLRAHNGKYVVAENGGGGVVNANRDSAQEWETFVIKRMTGAGRIGHGDSIALGAHNGQYLVAERGGGREVLANRDHAREWETFTITNVNAHPTILSGNEINLRAHNDQYVVAETDGRTTDPEALARGYEWKGGCGLGVGSGFDIMDDNCRSIMMGAYDRIKCGWLRPRFLTPDNRGCYMLRPSIDFNEALVLWDPQFPKEWYLVENRQQRPDIDEVPGSGLAITWVCEETEYWEPWLQGEVHLMFGRFPALISAVAPGAAQRNGGPNHPRSDCGFQAPRPWLRIPLRQLYASQRGRDTLALPYLVPLSI